MSARVPLSASPDVQQAVRDLQAQIDVVLNGSVVDMKQRRVVNAGRSINSGDYVTRIELLERTNVISDRIAKLEPDPSGTPVNEEVNGNLLVKGMLTVGLPHMSSLAQTVTASTLRTQFAAVYDAADYMTITVSAVGTTTIATVGPTSHLVLSPGAATANVYSQKPLGVMAGITTVSAQIHAVQTTEQLRLGNTSSKYVSFTVNSSGQVTEATTGTAGSAHIVLTPEATSFAYSTRPFGVMATPATVSAQLVARATTEQLRLEYDATHYASHTVASGGTMDVTSTDATTTMSITSSTATTQLRIANTGASYATFAVGAAGSLDIACHSATNADMYFTSVGTGTFYFNAGDVGIGVGLGSVAAKLHVTKTTKQLRIGYDDATNFCDFTVDSAGNTAIKVNGTTPALTLQGRAECNNVFRATGSATIATGTGLEIGVTGGVAFAQGFNRTGAVYVQTNIEGNPLVLNSGAAQGVVISGATGGNKGNNTINCNTYYGAGTAGVSAGSFGTVTAITTVGGIVTQLTGVSDARLKDVSGFYLAGLEALRQLRPVRYHWSARAALGIGMDRTREYVGLLAQNLEDAMPDAVGQERWADKSVWKTIDERRVLMAVINAIQELDRRQTALEQKAA